MDEGIKEILQRILQQNNEIHEDIKQMKQDLSQNNSKMTELSEKVDELEIENSGLKSELEKVNRKDKENSIIIFGIVENQEEGNQETINSVKKVFREKLNIVLENNEINNIYRIGQKNTGKIRPIILQFVRYITKLKVIQNRRKLKDTKISIDHDLTTQERKEHQVLYKHYKEAKDKNYQAVLQRKKVIINGDTYTYRDLIDNENLPKQKIRYLSNSAPGTPDISKRGQGQNTDEKEAEEKLFGSINTKGAEPKNNSQEGSYATRNYMKSKFKGDEKAADLPPLKKIKK